MIEFKPHRCCALITDFVAETDIEKCELCFTGRRGLLRLSVEFELFYTKSIVEEQSSGEFVFFYTSNDILSPSLSPPVSQTVSRGGQQCSSKCWASTAGLAIVRKATATSLCPTHRAAAITWPSVGGPWVPLWSMNCVVSSLEALRSLRIWHFRPCHPLLRWGLGVPQFHSSTVPPHLWMRHSQKMGSLFQNLKGKYQRLTLFVKQVTWQDYKIWFSVKNQISNKFWFFKKKFQFQGNYLGKYGFRTESTGRVNFRLQCIQQSRYLPIVLFEFCKSKMNLEFSNLQSFPGCSPLEEERTFSYRSFRVRPRSFACLKIKFCKI